MLHGGLLTEKMAAKKGDESRASAQLFSMITYFCPTFQLGAC